MLTILYNFVEIPIVIFIINFAFSDPLERHGILYLDIAILCFYLVDTVLVRWRIGYDEMEKM